MKTGKLYFALTQRFKFANYIENNTWMFGNIKFISSVDQNTFFVLMVFSNSSRPSASRIAALRPCIFKAQKFVTAIKIDKNIVNITLYIFSTFSLAKSDLKVLYIPFAYFGAFFLRFLCRV